MVRANRSDWCPIVAQQPADAAGRVADRIAACGPPAPTGSRSRRASSGRSPAGLGLGARGSDDLARPGALPRPGTRTRVPPVRQRLERRGPVGAELFERLGLSHLVPEVERHRRRGPRVARAAPRRRTAAAGRRSRGASSRSSAASCRATTASRSAASDTTASTSAGDLHRILAVIEDAAAVHRGRHGRGRVGQHRHAHVERFHQRHAEALVLAGAQEHVGDVVIGRELLVADVARASARRPRRCAR